MIQFNSGQIRILMAARASSYSYHLMILVIYVFFMSIYNDMLVIGKFILIIEWVLHLVSFLPALVTINHTNVINFCIEGLERFLA